MIPIDTIVVPQGAEYQAVCRGLKKARVNTVRVIPIPIGTKNLEQTLANCCWELANARNVLIAGLCGSLSKQHSVGDTVLYQSCRNTKNERVDLRSQLTTVISQELSVNLVDGLTCDRVIWQATEKLGLNQTYFVNVVDMEGYNYIQEFQRKDLNVAMLRVVSDDLKDIPNLNTAIDDDGNLKTIPMAIAFFKQPFAALRLIRGSLIGLQKLQNTTYQLILACSKSTRIASPNQY